MPTSEAGIVNMTEDETIMMVHYSKVRSQQVTLVRIKVDENSPYAHRKCSQQR